MGLLSERARLAHLDYVRLAATEGCSLYFSQFLENGFDDWSRQVRNQYPALRDWQGIREIQLALRGLMDAPHQCEVLLANRTAQLMKLALRQLCENSRRILVSDLTWPSYGRIFDLERSRHRIGFSTVGVRRMVRTENASVEDVVDRFVRDYENMSCDGLFVPAISHDGIRLPIDTICQRLNQVRPLRFVVVDGAQALGHVVDETGIEHCDIFIAGCHKWLQGHLPMGVAYLPNPTSAKKALVHADTVIRHRELDDPLLAFTREMLTGRTHAYSETVSLASLFTCRAAIVDRETTAGPPGRAFAERLDNADRVGRIANDAGWFVLPEAMPTGIVMLQATCDNVRTTLPDMIREFFVRQSVSVSTYKDGVIRLAMPDKPLTMGEMDLLAWVLRRCRFDDPGSEPLVECKSSAMAEVSQPTQHAL